MINVKNISKSFSDLKVIDDISFDVAKGEIVSLIGESGCGKTTILRCLSSIINPDCGKIELHGNISYVPQDLGLAWWLSAIDNIRLPLKLKNINDEEKVESVLSLVGLKQFSKYNVNTLSGGMKQRVALARSLVSSPDIILLDEPFRSLDDLIREKINEDLIEIWKKVHITVVLVTHSIREAIFLSDKILVFSKRPAKIKKIVEVTIPKPRIMYGKDIEELAIEIRDCLRE